MGKQKLHYVAIGHVRASPLVFSASPVSHFLKMLPSSDFFCTPSQKGLSPSADRSECV